MNDLEFDVLDELYFVTSFYDLMSSVDFDKEAVLNTLESMINKGWVKCFLNATEELMPDEIEFKTNYSNYHYLATKAGLLAHNSK